ncbi:membrane protein DedA with SNARE-associated domain [Scopulibacillus darangshiensis]|uniref:Membrane protein DedA with SNARE-associated domain n=1 Tax=Scopulibacillus darangshiensis TaxID=442528 RepID=A0A4R2NFC7_9BACL|nr:VTT domain-containing protein [Scopulibacillus darangshiensis]TCP19967.1 membrane protein DedA with SNARE-associated domain [Scopulibacillus darangshiensis]
MDTLIELLDKYGYIILFLSLMLELIALPIPTELMMSYVGYMVYQGEMNWFISIGCGILGSISGMTVAYWLGLRLGSPFFYRYGHRIHLGPERLNKMSEAFNKYGKRLLLFAPFIPGVRHITGYTAGITKVPFKSFAFFSYLGAVIWVTTFVTLGKLLGPQYELIETAAKKYMILFILALAILVLLYYVVKSNSTRIKLFFFTLLKSLYSDFSSQLKLKLLVAGAAVAFIGLTSLTIGLVEEYLNHEFSSFNQTTMLIFQAMFDEDWQPVMRGSLALSTRPAIAIGGCLTLIWIFVKGKNRGLEIKIMMIMIAGSIVFVTYLPNLISFLMDKSGIPVSLYHYNSPSSEVVMAAIVYGFLIFLVSRHAEKYRFKIMTNIFGLVILAYIGAGHLYFHLQPPSDILSSYVLAGVWLSFIILLLEIWRLVIILTSHDNTGPKYE